MNLRGQPVEETEDNEDRDFQTEGVITSYTQFELHRSRVPLTPGNILRPIARALGHLGAHLNVSLSSILIEVSKAYDNFVENGIAATIPKRIQVQVPVPVQHVQPLPMVQIDAPSYNISVPGDIANKLTEAGLIAPCTPGHFHPELPDDAPLQEHEQLKAQIERFIAGLRN